MGVAAAFGCLNEAGCEMPEAIITGTAYGCLEDTGVFLSKMVEQHEELLSPTAFIQSTHNTVGAQIALMLRCRNYNNTFVHRGLSFESALLDAMLLMQEQTVSNALVGGVDAIRERVEGMARISGDFVSFATDDRAGTLAERGEYAKKNSCFQTVRGLLVFFYRH